MNEYDKKELIDFLEYELGRTITQKRAQHHLIERTNADRDLEWTTYMNSRIDQLSERIMKFEYFIKLLKEESNE